MTSIKIEVPANDTIALTAMAEALQRIADERAPQELTESFTHTVKPAVVETPVVVETPAVVETPVVVETPAVVETPVVVEVNDTLDADGIPHDNRIHSKGATRLADDTWRLKRKPADKTDEEWDEYVKSVKAELKAVQDIPVTPPEAEFTEQQAIDHIGNANDNHMDIVEPTPPVVDELAESLDITIKDKTVEISPPLTVPNEMGDSNVPERPIAPVTPPTSLAPPVVEAASDKPNVTTFQELMLYITSDAKKRGADNDMIKATLLEVDPALVAIPLIATRTDLIPKFVTALEAKLV